MVLSPECLLGNLMQASVSPSAMPLSLWPSLSVCYRQSPTAVCLFSASLPYWDTHHLEAGAVLYLEGTRWEA